jgi:antitoxin VapB
MQTAKLFKNGQSQAVRLPKEYRFEGNTVAIKKVGNAVILTPIVSSWDQLLESITMFPANLVFPRDQPELSEKERF